MTKQNPMAYKPIFPLLISMAFPPMISMLIQSLYNIVDSVFVARLGLEELTAVSLIFPLQNLSIAVSVGIGVAMNAFIARALGQHNEKEASFIATQGMVMSILHSLIFIIIGLFFIKPFVAMFTQNQTVYEYALQYGIIVITFTFGSFIHIAIEKMFQATGNMLIPMLMQIFGAVINIILDPILIFGYFGLPALGVIGAALATIIGQFGACFLSIYLFKRHSEHIHISFKNFKLDLSVFQKLYSIAIPSSVMLCLPSLLVSLLNGMLASISQTAVAFFGIYFKLQTFIYMPANGVIQGMRPILSYNYGANHTKRMNQTLKVSGLTIFIILLLGTMSFFIFPEFILAFFNASDEMLKIGIPGLRILSLSFVFSTFGILMSGTFEALAKGKESLVISLLRQFIITIPLAFILLHNIGLIGVWYSFVLAEAIASIVSILLYINVYKKMSIS